MCTGTVNGAFSISVLSYFKERDGKISRVYLFVLFRFYVTFNNPSGISWRCLEVAASSVLECCLAEILLPRHMP